MALALQHMALQDYLLAGKVAEQLTLRLSSLAKGIPSYGAQQLLNGAYVLDDEQSWVSGTSSLIFLPYFTPHCSLVLPRPVRRGAIFPTFCPGGAFLLTEFGP